MLPKLLSKLVQALGPFLKPEVWAWAQKEGRDRKDHSQIHLGKRGTGVGRGWGCQLVTGPSPKPEVVMKGTNMLAS